MNPLNQTTNQNTNHPDDVPFDDLAAGGADARTIAVARALAAARREAPAGLVGVRWAAAAEADCETDNGGDVEPVPVVVHDGDRWRRPAAGQRRERRWWPQLVAGTVAIALVAVLWAWVVPWLSATTIRQMDDPLGVGVAPLVPPGPSVGTWKVAAQLGGETLAIARDGSLLVAGRGRHVEAYDLSDMDSDGRPRYLGESEMLPGRPNSLAVTNGMVFVGVDLQPKLWVLDAPWRTPTASNRQDRSRGALTIRQTLPTAGPISRLVVNDSGTSVWIAGITSRGSQAYRSPGPLVLVRSSASETDVPTVVRPGDAAGSVVYDVAVVGHTIFGATGEGITVTDSISGTERLVDDLKDVRRIEATGSRLYALGRDASQRVIRCYDVRVPGSPVAIGTWPLDPVERDVELSASGDMLVIVVRDEGGKSGRIDVVDMADPAHPRLQRYRHVIATAPVLRGNHLALGIQNLWDGWQLDVLDIGWGDWNLPGTSPPPMDSEHWPLLGSPMIAGIDGWEHGALTLSSLNTGASSIVWPRSDQIVLTHFDEGRPLRGIDHLSIAMGEPWSWRPSRRFASFDSFVAQAAEGRQAAALLVRNLPGGRVDVGLIAWTVADDPMRWGASAAGLGDRIAWAPFVRPDEPEWDDRWPVFDRVIWQLVVNDRFAVAIDGYKEGRRVLVYDVSTPERPRLLSDVPDIELDAQGAELWESRLYAHNSDEVVAYELADAKPMSRIVRHRSDRAISDIAPTEQGLLVLRDQDLELWPYDGEGGPDVERAEKLISTEALFTEAPGGMDMVLDGSVAYIATMTLDHSRVLVGSYDLVKRASGPLIEVPAHGFDMTPQLAVANGRIYLTDAKGGMFILERRLRERGNLAPSATRAAPRSDAPGLF